MKEKLGTSLMSLNTYKKKTVDSTFYYLEGIKKENGTSHINVGTGKDISINELSNLIKEIVGFSGEIYFNKEMPDGTPKKLLDVSCMEDLGWTSKIKFKKGLTDLYDWYQKNENSLRN